MTVARNEAAKILEDANQAEITNKAKIAALQRAIEGQEAIKQIENRYTPRIDRIQRKTGELKVEENQIQIRSERQQENPRRHGGGDFDPDRAQSALRNADPKIAATAQTIADKIGESSAAYLEGLQVIAQKQDREMAKIRQDLWLLRSQFQNARMH